MTNRTALPELERDIHDSFIAEIFPNGVDRQCVRVFPGTTGGVDVVSVSVPHLRITDDEGKSHLIPVNGGVEEIRIFDECPSAGEKMKLSSVWHLSHDGETLRRLDLR